MSESYWLKQNKLPFAAECEIKGLKGTNWCQGYFISSWEIRKKIQFKYILIEFGTRLAGCVLCPESEGSVQFLCSTFLEQSPREPQVCCNSQSGLKTFPLTTASKRNWPFFTLYSNLDCGIQMNVVPYKVTYFTVIPLQKWWRLYRPVEEEEEVEDYDPTVQEGAALCLQTHWRAYRERQRFKLWRDAALVLQRAWRLALYRRRTAALVIQTAWRCHQARGAYLRLYTAVVQLQALSRGYLTRQK